jgi:hypothetical protein
LDRALTNPIPPIVLWLIIITKAAVDAENPAPSIEIKLLTALFFESL